MRLDANKSIQFSAEVPAALTADEVVAKLEIEAKCGCGGDMIRVGRTLEWKCSRQRWWRFWDRKHAHLVAQVEVRRSSPAQEPPS